MLQNANCRNVCPVFNNHIHDYININTNGDGSDKNNEDEKKKSTLCTFYLHAALKMEGQDSQPTGFWIT